MDTETTATIFSVALQRRMIGVSVAVPVNLSSKKLDQQGRTYRRGISRRKYILWPHGGRGREKETHRHGLLQRQGPRRGPLK